MTYPRLSIRPTTYRGVAGFSITGRKEERGWPVRVFVPGTDRAYAERVKSRIVEGAEQIFEEE